MTTNPRTARRRRRSRVRIRRALGLAGAMVLTATALLVIPAGASSSGHYSATPQESLADIQAYWADTYPAVYGKKYVAIPTDRVHPYSADDPPPGCGTKGTTPYREVAGNAFYCEDGDFIAYDVEGLIPALRETYGDVAVGLVLAHEMGHAIQARGGSPDGAFVSIELQADCFAGAWTRHVADGDDTDLELSSDDLDRALSGFLVLRDPSGTDGGQAGAHGNAFDRVSAFQDGLRGGAAACRDYETDPPEVTEAGFTSYEDQQINGDPPLTESLPMITKNLDAYWERAAKKYQRAPELVATRSSASCSGESDRGVVSDSVVYCADSRTIVYVTGALQDASDEIGDMGAGVYIAAAWASAVQDDLGYDLGSSDARERSDCLTGAWAGAVEAGTATTSRSSAAISFSPGDLDEVIAAFVATDAKASKVDRGTVFDRFTAFRTGFEGGPDACFSA